MLGQARCPRRTAWAWPSLTVPTFCVSGTRRTRLPEPCLALYPRECKKGRSAPAVSDPDGRHRMLRRGLLVAAAPVVAVVAGEEQDRGDDQSDGDEPDDHRRDPAGATGVVRGERVGADRHR